MNPMDEPKKEEEKKGGGVPIIRLPQKPLLKIKGSGFGTTLIERLKQFKRKDLAFIAAGLSVLILAPVAEHFLMKPETDRGLVPGFATRGGFPVGSPYEPGINGLAPGGLPGQEQDIITPLNARDPSALVLGPGGLTPPTPPPPKTDTGMRDALAKSLATGTQEAVKRAGLPSLPPRLAGGFKGFGGGGGGGAGYSPQVAVPKDRGPLPAAGSSLARVKPIPGMRGFMRGRGPAQGPSPESLKRASQDAGDLFNAPGAASSALDRAAGKGIPGGGDSLGGGTSGPAGEGAEGKFGGATTKEAKSLGETLDFLRRKMEMEKQLELKYKPLEKALDLEWKLKEWDKMYPRRMREEMYKSLFLGPAGEAMKTLTGEATKRVLDVFAPPGQKSYRCVLGNGQVQTITSGMLNMFGCSVRPASGGLLTCGGKASETRVPEGWVGAQCTPSGGADDGNGKPPPGGPQTPNLPGAQPGQDPATSVPLPGASLDGLYDTVKVVGDNIQGQMNNNPGPSTDEGGRLLRVLGILVQGKAKETLVGARTDIQAAETKHLKAARGTTLNPTLPTMGTAIKSGQTYTTKANVVIENLNKVTNETPPGAIQEVVRVTRQQLGNMETDWKGAHTTVEKVPPSIQTSQHSLDDAGKLVGAARIEQNKFLTPTAEKDSGVAVALAEAQKVVGQARAAMEPPTPVPPNDTKAPQVIAGMRADVEGLLNQIAGQKGFIPQLRSGQKQVREDKFGVDATNKSLGVVRDARTEVMQTVRTDAGGLQDERVKGKALLWQTHTSLTEAVDALEKYGSAKAERIRLQGIHDTAAADAAMLFAHQSTEDHVNEKVRDDEMAQEMKRFKGGAAGGDSGGPAAEGALPRASKANGGAIEALGIQQGTIDREQPEFKGGVVFNVPQ